MSHRSRPCAKIVLFFAQITVFVGEKGRFFCSKKGFWEGDRGGRNAPSAYGRVYFGVFIRNFRISLSITELE